MTATEEEREKEATTRCKQCAAAQEISVNVLSKLDVIFSIKEKHKMVLARVPLITWVHSS